MKRIIDYHLRSWKNDPYRKPLLVRGARQIGKTFSIRNLGASFEHFVEINLEERPEAVTIFEKNLDPVRIIAELSAITGKDIRPGSTLLFIDEIQMMPRAITALRYFYEKMPELHVIGAGSLLDFAIEEVGISVGRVQFLYMFPLSFIEFLAALGNTVLIKEILSHDPTKEISDVIHRHILALLGDYCAIGGMPYVVQMWQKKKNPLACAQIHSEIINAYRQDFSKYAKKSHIPYVELIFNAIPMQMSKKFKYSVIQGTEQPTLATRQNATKSLLEWGPHSPCNREWGYKYRKRELAPALNLLVTARVAHKVFYSAGQGIPLGAQTDLQNYKVIFLDIALAQSLLDLDLAGWLIDPFAEFINKGSIIEAFIGQEILAYDNPRIQKNLYYWQRETRGSEAEIDYLIQLNAHIIPIEVKSGTGSTLKSMHSFLASHSHSPYGIRFSTNNYSVHEQIHSMPLYAVAAIMIKKNSELRAAIEELI